MTAIKKFVIYGERCSGTNFLENAIAENFDVTLNTDYGSKHFFCFNSYDSTSNDILFIGIIRNPIYWVNSLSTELHNIPSKNSQIKDFLNNPFYSVDEVTNKIMLDDMNWYNNKIYEDVYELRKNKNFYLINIMPKKVKNFILINYEALLYNYEHTLDFIQQKFNLNKKYTVYKQIEQYKKSDSYKFVQQRNILLTPPVVEEIWSKLHVYQENKLGYFKGDNNNFFKNKSNVKFITS